MLCTHSCMLCTILVSQSGIIMEATYLVGKGESENLLPVCFCLLPDKTSETYEVRIAHYNEVKNACFFVIILNFISL